MKKSMRGLALGLVFTLVLLSLLPVSMAAGSRRRIPLSLYWVSGDVGNIANHRAMSREEILNYLRVTKDGREISDWTLEGKESPYTLLLPEGDGYRLGTKEGALALDEKAVDAYAQSQGAQLYVVKTKELSLSVQELLESSRNTLTGRHLEEAAKAFSFRGEFQNNGQKVPRTLAFRVNDARDKIILYLPEATASVQAVDTGEGIYGLTSPSVDLMGRDPLLVVSRARKVSLLSDFLAPEKETLTLEGPAQEERDFSHNVLVKNLSASTEYTIRYPGKTPGLSLIASPFEEQKGLRVKDNVATLRLGAEEKQRVALALERNVDLVAERVREGEDILLRLPEYRAKEIYLLRNGRWESSREGLRRDSYISYRTRTPLRAGEELTMIARLSDNTLTNPLSLTVEKADRLGVKLLPLRRGDRSLVLTGPEGILIQGLRNGNTLMEKEEKSWTIPASERLVIPLESPLREGDEIVIRASVKDRYDLILGEVSEAALERIFGVDRYETSALLSKKTYEQAGAVILANGGHGTQASPDALAAGPLSQLWNAPILLTRRDEIPTAVLEEIRRLNPDQVFVMGGENSVARKSLEVLSMPVNSIHIFDGADRYETAALAAAPLLDGREDATVLVANGVSLVDALSINPYAMERKAPILLARENNLPKATQKILDRPSVTRVELVGGRASLGLSLERELGEKYKKRLAGEDRYGTAREIAKELKRERVVVASGVVSVDALSSAPYAWARDAAILLVRPNRVPEPTLKALREGSYQSLTVVGGEQVIGNDVFRELEKEMK